MGEIIFIALMVSAPLWFIVDKLSDIDIHIQEMLYEDEEDTE